MRLQLSHRVRVGILDYELKDLDAIFTNLADKTSEISRGLLEMNMIYTRNRWILRQDINQIHLLRSSSLRLKKMFSIRLPDWLLLVPYVIPEACRNYSK
jgi:hypothetical protein